MGGYLNATELFDLKCLISRYVNFTSTNHKKKRFQNILPLATTASSRAPTPSGHCLGPSGSGLSC